MPAFYVICPGPLHMYLYCLYVVFMTYLYMCMYNGGVPFSYYIEQPTSSSYERDLVCMDFNWTSCRSGVSYKFRPCPYHVSLHIYICHCYFDCLQLYLQASKPTPKTKLMERETVSPSLSRLVEQTSTTSGGKMESTCLMR